MVDPKNIREFSIYMDEFGRRLEDRIGEVSKKVWWLMGLLGGLVVGAIALYTQVIDVKTELKADIAGLQAVVLPEISALKAETSALSDRISAVDTGVAELKTAGQEILAAVTSGPVGPREDTPSPLPTLDLLPILTIAAADPQLIRGFVGAAPRTQEVAKIVVGDTLPDSALKPLPSDLVEKVPALKDIRYAIDVNNAVALAEPTANRVFVII